MKINERSQTEHRGVTFCAARAWRWRCPGWSRCRCSAQEPRRRRQPRPTSRPLRFACVYFSNGVEPIHWWAKGSGADHGDRPRRRAADAASARTWSSSAACSTSRRSSPPARTWAACRTCSPAPRSAWIRTRSASAPRWTRCWRSRSAAQTAVPSLVLGIEPNELRLEDGLSMIYGSCISWASPTKPATKEIYPARAFDQLVGDGKGRQLDRSILDAVLQETHDLQPQDQPRRPHEARRVSRIGPRHREAHRARVARTSGSKAGGRRSTSRTCRVPPTRLPQNVPDHMKLMLDLIVLAFQMDKTRIAT